MHRKVFLLQAARSSDNTSQVLFQVSLIAGHRPVLLLLPCTLLVSKEQFPLRSCVLRAPYLREPAAPGIRQRSQVYFATTGI